MKPLNRIPQYTTYRGYTATRQLPIAPRPARRKPKLAVVALIVAGLIGIMAYGVGYQNHAQADKSPTSTALVADTEPVNNCATNKLNQQILIDINRRHLWACQETKQVYDAAVITGRENVAENKTPRGNFRIYAKATDTTLSGSDSSGSWSDPVHYWMPFLDNQYGTYGLHDATWRSNKEFGNVTPDSKDASHGCVEMPLAAMKWLYDWAPIGATVTVQD